MRACRECGAPLPALSRRGRPPAYCREACRRAARRARQRATKAEAVGSRREGFAFQITDPETGRTIEGRWRPRYLEEDRDRLPRIDPERDPAGDLAGLIVFEGSRHRGGIRAVGLKHDEARRWAIDARGVDLEPGL